LTSGIATYATSALPVGTESITAVSSGDSNFNTVTSAAVSEQVQDLSLTLTSGGATTATAVPGGEAVYPLVISPLAGTKFPGPVTLTLSGLPAGATGSLTPNTLPANSGTTPVKLVVNLPRLVGMQHRRYPLGGAYMPLACGVMLLPFVGKLRRAARQASPLACLLLIGIATASLVGLAGCGGPSSGYIGQAPQTYTLTITATSGSLSHSTTVNLTVE
jgi:hypothetical protein